MNGQTDRQTDRQAGRQIDRRTDEQAGDGRLLAHGIMHSRRKSERDVYIYNIEADDDDDDDDG